MTGAAISPSLVRENRELAAELKFLVPHAVGAQICAWARANLLPDPHGKGEHQDQYRIHSIYFDTPEFDVFHRRGSYGRSKFRIRRYDDDERIFLERKLRTNGMLTKRRSTVSVADLRKLLEPQNGFWNGSWYHRRLSLRRLQPVCQIVYERTARLLMAPYGAARLTVDQQVHAAPTSEIVFAAGELAKRLLHDAVIVEMKYCVELPTTFKLLLEEFAVPPAKISKYRLAARELGLVQETQEPPETPQNASAAAQVMAS